MQQYLTWEVFQKSFNIMFKKVWVTLCLIHSVVVTMRLYDIQWRLKKFTASGQENVGPVVIFTQLSMNLSNKIINSVHLFRFRGT